MENTRNFPEAKKILTAIRTGLREQQIWRMLEEANKVLTSRKHWQ